jgi:hypothetical protein
VQVLPLLVQLPELRAQGAVDEHADLSSMCHQSALTKTRLLAAGKEPEDVAGNQ